MANFKKVDPVGYIWSLLRIGLGTIFLWSFVDKLYGLGFTTCRDVKTQVVDIACNGSWLNGGSPTNGFLEFGTKGPFAGFFQSLAGNTALDWLYMLTLLLVGVALILGISVRLAAISGSIFLLLVWLATLPPEHHPAVDEHIIYTLVLAGLFFAPNQPLSLSRWWNKLSIVRRLPILR